MFNPFQITNLDGTTTDDTSKITRLTLLYWQVNKKWRVHKDIKNPKFNIITQDGSKKAFFGKYVFENKYGFNQNQIMFIVAYFET